MNEIEFGFVAALEREVERIVRGWSRIEVAGDGSDWTIYQKGNAALICAGTGKKRAYSATRALIEHCSPKVIRSIGFAGACVEFLHPGTMVVPATIIDAETGRKFECAFGTGQLLTLDRVAGVVQKRDASERFGAMAVDMEAAGVAEAALEAGKAFGAIKVVSDDMNEDLDFLADFVSPAGFDTRRFIAHIAFRPWLWPRVADLQIHSEVAVKTLASAVELCMVDQPAFETMYCFREQV